MAKWHTLPSNAVLEELHTTENGISESEAQSRLQASGYNELKEKKKISPLTLFIEQFKNFLVFILIAAAVISYFIGNLVDTILITAIIILNALFGFFQEFKAEKTLESLKKLSAPQAKVIRDGEEKLIVARELVPGDIFIVQEGDKIPADARIIETLTLRVDESSLTGESTPVSKTDKPIGDVALAERKNMLYLGTVATYGHAKAVVVDTGMNTEIGKIAKLIQTAEEETPLQAKVNAFGKWLGVIVIVITVISGAIGIVKDYAIPDMLLTSAALAVAAIPEGLPALLTIALAIGVQKMSRQKAIVRKLSAVESLGSTTIIVADKTGTMTTNEMTVRKIFVDDEIIEVTGQGFEPKGEFLLKNKKINPEENDSLKLSLMISALCNDAVLNKEDNRWSLIGDPTEGALIVAAKKAGIYTDSLSKEHHRVSEVPFSSERKMMTTVNKSGKYYLVCSKGAPEVILNKCSKIRKYKKETTLTDATKKRILSIVEEFASNGLRVLTAAYKQSTTVEHSEKALESNLIFVGLLAMMDPPRPEVGNAIQLANKAGIEVIMVTGDHKNTAVAIAKELGLDGESLTGEDLDKMSEEKLAEVVEKIRVFARVSPAHKSRIVKVLRKRGHIVAVTGDGVNDAPALKDAHIGVAMGIKGTDVAKEASEMVLADDNFATIVKAVEEGRTIYDNIRKFIRYILGANLGEIIIISLAILLGMPLPLVPLQLLWVNLVTDGLPALALGFDTKDKDIMKRKPRNPKETIMYKLLPFIIAGGILFGLSSLLMFYLEFKDGTIEKARTMAFTTVVIFELIFVFNCRSEDKSVWRINPFSNRLLILAVLTGLLLQIAIVYVPILNTWFKTVPLHPFDWLIITLISATGLLIIPKIFIH